MNSVKYVQPNLLIANINEKIDELNRKIIPTCTLKHSDQKKNVLQLIGKFKSVVTNILSQLNQNEVDYNLINFAELYDSLEKAYKLLLDEIVLPYEKIDLTDLNNRLNKLEDDIRKIPVVPANLNTQWESVKINANKVPGLVTDLAGLNSYMVNFEDVTIDNIHGDIDRLKDDLERSIDDKRGELDELTGRMSYFEDDIVDGIRSDIDYLKDEVKKNVSIPSDLNEKWNSVMDNANQVTGLIEQSNNFASYLNSLDDNMYDRRNELEQLQQDRDEIKYALEGIKETADYLEGCIIEIER
jgi:hypothetical protein